MSTPNADSAEGAGAESSAAEVDDFDLPLTTDDADDSDSDDEEVTPVAAKAKVEPTPEPKSTTDEDELESLRKKREERRAKLEAERSKVDASGRVKELEEKAAKLEVAQGYAKAGQRLKAMQEMGIDLNDAIAEHLETMEEGAAEGIAPSAGDKALLKRLEALEAELNEKKAAEQAAIKAAEAQQLQQRQQAGYQGALNKVKEVLSTDPDAYEVINKTGLYAEVYAEFGEYCKQHSITFAADNSEEEEAVAMFKEFARRADDAMADRYAAAAATKKVQSRLGGKMVAANTAKAGAKTATRGGHVAPPVTTDDDFADVVDPRKRARLLGGRFKLSEQ